MPEFRTVQVMCDDFVVHCPKATNIREKDGKVIILNDDEECGWFYSDKIIGVLLSESCRVFSHYRPVDEEDERDDDGESPL
jgi:hypothetical protein